MQMYVNMERVDSFQCKRLHVNVLIEHLAHKLLRKVTRVLDSFVKIPVFLKKYTKKILYR